MIKVKDLDAGERISPEAEFLSNEADYRKFLRRLYEEEGIDLSHYKQNQMRRRLNMTVKSHGYESYCRFLDFAKKEEAVYRRFIDRITINVSEFLRNHEKFETLEKQFLVPLLKQKPNLNLWSAGCSTGEELYSLALLLEKHNASLNAQVLGWDFDQNALDRAKVGIYESKALANVSPQLLKRYFIKVGENRYQVGERLKARVRLEKRNLLEERFPHSLDIILCRNVVIYFKDHAKERLFSSFANALAKEGVLMIGASERIPNADQLGLRSPESFFYVPKDSAYPQPARRRR